LVLLNQEEFHQQVRDALHHLYDYPYLENHPLALRCWPKEGRGGPSRAHRLSRLLLESIEELNPPGKAAVDTSHLRFSSLLAYRFVEERPLADIMHELGYSRSQFFREQQKAITMLASVLREKLSQQVPIAEAGTLLDIEAERVLAQREEVDLAKVLQGVLEVVSHLAEQHDVSLAYDLASGLPSFYGSRVLLRQVLLKGLSNLISQTGARQVDVRIRCEERFLIIELVIKPGSPTGQPDRTASYREPNMEPVQRLAEMMGGRWQRSEVNPEECIYRFDFPVENEKTLLVIEDNEGLIRAFQGYLAGYDYLVIGATTGDEALKLAREVLPAAITLDIMMPNQDGWEILQALKSDSVTQAIPVIICSVLEDPELARSLGATAYLQKPVSQAELLDALNKLPGTE
jgi:CheY-like chemotaxis protein